MQREYRESSIVCFMETLHEQIVDFNATIPGFYSVRAHRSTTVSGIRHLGMLKPRVTSSTLWQRDLRRDTLEHSSSSQVIPTTSLSHPHSQRLASLSNAKVNKTIDLLYANVKDAYSSTETLQGALEATYWDVLYEPHSEDIDGLTDCISGYIGFGVDNSIPT